MSKKYDIIGIIISIIIIVYGIVFFIDIGGYVTLGESFDVDMTKNMLIQMQNINANIVKVNNSIHRGIGMLISSIGFISVSYFIYDFKKK